MTMQPYTQPMKRHLFACAAMALLLGSGGSAQSAASLSGVWVAADSPGAVPDGLSITEAANALTVVAPSSTFVLTLDGTENRIARPDMGSNAYSVVRAWREKEDVFTVSNTVNSASLAITHQRWSVAGDRLTLRTRMYRPSANGLEVYRESVQAYTRR